MDFGLPWDGLKEEVRRCLSISLQLVEHTVYGGKLDGSFISIPEHLRDSEDQSATQGRGDYRSFILLNFKGVLGLGEYNFS